MNQPFTISVPRLRTERLTLREYRVEDFELFADHLSNAESSAHLGSADRATAWRIFSSHAGFWLLSGAGWWSIADRQTGQLVVRHAGFRSRPKPDDDLTPPIGPMPLDFEAELAYRSNISILTVVDADAPELNFN